MAEAQDYAASRTLSLPVWATEPPTLGAEQTKELGQYCREALAEIAASSDAAARKWLAEAIAKATRPQAQVVELVLAIKGVILIGMILAARVRKIDKDGVAFYQGMPTGLKTLLTAAKGFFT